MMRNQIPTISFSRWIPWDKRDFLQGFRAPGVYLLAHFDRAPIDRVNPKVREIVYIGETHDRSLKKRWDEFNHSASTGIKDHSGGRTYRSKFGPPRKDLYVAAYPVEKMGEGCRSPFILYVERKLIWEFACKWDQRPECNLK